MAENVRKSRGYLMMVLVGNLGADPEMRYTPNGTAVTNFSLAVGQREPAGDDEYEIRTVWFRVTTWGKLAEITNEHLAKGRKVLVEVDRITVDPNTGGPKIYSRSDGTAGASFEVKASAVHFLPSSNGEPPAGPTNNPSAEEDIIPF